MASDARQLGVMIWTPIFLLAQRLWGPQIHERRNLPQVVTPYKSKIRKRLAGDVSHVSTAE